MWTRHDTDKVDNLIDIFCKVVIYVKCSSYMKSKSYWRLGQFNTNWDFISPFSCGAGVRLVAAVPSAPRPVRVVAGPAASSQAVASVGAAVRPWTPATGTRTPTPATTPQTSPASSRWAVNWIEKRTSKNVFNPVIPNIVNCYDTFKQLDYSRVL